MGPGRVGGRVVGGVRRPGFGTTTFRTFNVLLPKNVLCAWLGRAPPPPLKVRRVCVCLLAFSYPCLIPHPPRVAIVHSTHGCNIVVMIWGRVLSGDSDDERLITNYSQEVLKRGHFKYQ